MQALADDTIPDTFELTSAISSMQLTITGMKKEITGFENELRGRALWHESAQFSAGPSTQPAEPFDAFPVRQTHSLVQDRAASPSPVDISDLSVTIDIPATITPPSPPSAPPATFQEYFSSRTWQWDSVWKELYTRDSSAGTFIYLSRWHVNQSTWLWEHTNFANTDHTLNAALRMITKWDKWKWDSHWGEWTILLPGDGTTACLYASPWKIQDDGRWAYVGRFRSGAAQGQA